jgi:hypothetical protein
MDESDDRWGWRTSGCRNAASRRGVLTGAAAAFVALGGSRQGLAQQGAAAQAPVTPPPAILSRAVPQPVAPPQAIEIIAKPIAAFERLNPGRRTHGRLEFRGGLILNSPSKDFGGWSGLVLSEDGRRLLSLSDRGSWLTAELQYDAGHPSRLVNAVLGEIAGVGGLSLKGRDKDSEAVTLVEGTLSRGTVLIGFERNHRIGRYPISERGIGAPLGFLKMPLESRRMSSNKGFEAVCFMRTGPLRGAVIAFSEELYDAARNHTGWIWPNMGGEGQRVGLTNIGDFAVTDLAALPDGSLIVLERKFRWLEGVKMRLRLIRAGQIKPGVLMDGEVLLEADMASEIDNMEGLALSRDARGQTVLTLISDNNFNGFLQRTILLQFALLPEATAKADDPNTKDRPR